MMMMMNDILQKWSGLNGRSGLVQRIDPNHPMDFFVGITVDGYDSLILITKNEPLKLASSQVLKVKKRLKNDGRWTTQIYLVEPENLEVFARLCVDLVECCRKSKSEREGLHTVTQRYMIWEKLFARIKDTLPNSVLKGLVGEMDFAKKLISRRISKDTVMDGWVGPDGADRDFVLHNTWYENKAISTGKDKVTISSLNQLDVAEDGFLTILNIDESTSTDSKALSVKKEIDDFRLLLEDAPEARYKFEKKLISLGYIDKNEYENIYFVKGNREYFKVNNTFPKLTPKNVASEIVSANYELSIAGINPWRIDEDKVWS